MEEKFDGYRISETTIWRIYKTRDIRYWLVHTKSALSSEEKKQKWRQFLESLACDIHDWKELIFIDEAIVNPKPFSFKCWVPREKCKFAFSHTKLNAMTVVGAYSSTRGLVFSSILDEPLDSFKFGQFLRELREHIHFEESSLIMDNCRVHHSHTIAALLNKYRERGLTARFLPPYSSLYNHIETFWAHMKTQFRKTIPLNTRWKLSMSDVWDLLTDAIAKVKEARHNNYITRCIPH